MALQKEIWINSIVEGLFAGNTFAARSLNHSEFVNNITVHVPNAGAAPGVTKGRNTFPATVSSRTDNDLTYSINEYTTDPFRIPNAEEVELSYNKRENAVAHAPSATGNRKAVTVTDILNLKLEFDKENIPQNGRCLLMDPVMYNQLLAALNGQQAAAFLASADAQKGIIGKIYGFDVYMRSTVLNVVAAGTSLVATAAATDSAAALAWHEDYVARAVGNVELFNDDNNPLYYGDVVSALVRAGGSYTSYAKKGVVLLYQAT